MPRLVPIREFRFQDYDGPAVQGLPADATLTCKNHTFLRWSTKNPYQRGLHYLGLAAEVEITKENAHYMWKECTCGFADLQVIVEEECNGRLNGDWNSIRHCEDNTEDHDAHMF